MKHLKTITISRFHCDASYAVVMTVLSLMRISHLLNVPNAVKNIQEVMMNLSHVMRHL